MVEDNEPRSTLGNQAVGEAHLSMQQAHQRLREARDHGGDMQAAQARLQHSILTFYGFLRADIKDESQLRAYWTGHIPDYPQQFTQTIGAAEQYYREHGTGVYQTQIHTGVEQVSQRALPDGGQPPQQPEPWHDLLDLSPTERVVAVGGDGGQFTYKTLRFAVIGLRELDTWHAKTVTERSSGGGFMSGETHQRTRKEFEPPQKLEHTKRMLVEAARDLGALPKYGVDDTRDAEFDYSDLLNGDHDAN